ncbi:uncharacterized protein J7T54_002950 [Emericellopsis cladophorae]|uniref:Glycosyltransferase 2 n=1 Tax=Emericellopsis cladophorae TaxID=2686198 RepID=A0A9P9XUB2_9HYPO|nr:uncharacterized protein J7T54_002950 [Emericellopsis cladophorae]KAI6777957.1 hypothetical protein J7T54_002950 [Emericellopsis cladophorae]
MMPAHLSRARATSRLWASDEELAKKDDDHLPVRQHQHQGPNGQWQAAVRMPRRRSVARLLAYIAITLFLFYVLSQAFTSSPHGDIQGLHRSSTLNGRPPPGRGSTGTVGETHDAASSVQKPKTYNGAVKLPSLGQSLHAIAGTEGKQPKNRNVLFAAASLKSASALLPLACQMALERRNYVHFAFMGRSVVPLQELVKINGIDNTCQMILHDARPDHAVDSTEQRMALCSARAMYHINTYMHPQAIFIDSTSAEESYFLRGLRDQTRGTASAIIELPERPGMRLAWITKLDSAALAAWDKITIHILVQAPTSGAGNIMRLLTSLSQVDMAAMPVPHLTVDLPHKAEPQTEKFLADFRWPPRTGANAHLPNMLSLHRRIPRTKLSAEESSVRFLESYWPKSKSHSYVLVLSPHTEVTPQFLHYLKFSILHYRHSNSVALTNSDAQMMGLSLATPTKLLDGSSPLTAPAPVEDGGSSFLWQAPLSDAMVIPGDKWMELHGFISHILELQALSTESPPLLAHKQISKKYPSWLEYVLQLSRIRGYYCMYPGQETSRVVVGVHNDLPDVPEEYSEDDEARRDAMGEGVGDEATAVFEPHWHVDILHTLPHGGNLPNLRSLSMLSWDGKGSSATAFDDDAAAYRARFMTEVGQCKDEQLERQPHAFADDLFCYM